MQTVNFTINVKNLPIALQKIQMDVYSDVVLGPSMAVRDPGWLGGCRPGWDLSSSQLSLSSAVCLQLFPLLFQWEQSIQSISF